VIRRHSSLLRASLVITDAMLAVISVVAVSMVRLGHAWDETWQTLLRQPGLVLLVYVAAWIAILWANGLYRPRSRWSVRSEARAVLQAAAWMTVAILVLLFALNFPPVSRLLILGLLVAQAAASLGSRAILRWLFAGIRREGRNTRNVLIVGTGSAAHDFAAKIGSHAELGLRVIGFVGDKMPDAPVGSGYLGSVDDLLHVVHTRVVDEIAICLPFEEWDLVDVIARLCEDEGKIVRIPVALPEVALTGHFEELDGTPVLSLLRGPDRILAMSAKRATDLVVSGAALILLGPLLLMLSAAMVVAQGRPVLFRQERVGLNGRPFSLVKFRTMILGAEARLAELGAHNEIRGPAFKLSQDPRITKLGAWLRRTSIDELPQLWNVLRGEMSLVGPRPPLPGEVAAYDIWHRRRLSMKPGITGLWQVEGRRESEFDRWVKKDLEYIDRWSPWLDVLILLRTIPAVIRANGR
jgi:exopolysaccharide biosynthesis polyprenyl glycosylphosphotransferase